MTATKPLTAPPSEPIRSITISRCENGWWVMVGSPMEYGRIRPVWVFNDKADLAEFIRQSEWSNP